MILHRRPLNDDESGSTIVEFALVLMPLLTLIMGSWEMGRQVYVSSIVHGVVVQAARKAGVENATAANVTTFVNSQLSEYADPGKITLSIKNFRKFSGIGKSEKITTDTAPLGTYNVGDCYIDANKNNVFDALQGNSGVGTADDAMEVKLTVEAKRLTPVGQWLGFGATYNIERTTFIQIEPYAGTVDPVERCI